MRPCAARRFLAALRRLDSWWLDRTTDTVAFETAARAPVPPQGTPNACAAIPTTTDEWGD